MAPVPVMVVEPTDSVTVQVPDTGSPLRATLPVAVVQVGWVIVPMIGADGVAGCALMVALSDAAEVHPSELVTVKV